MTQDWLSLVAQLEQNPALVRDLFEDNLEVTDALLLEELEAMLRKSADLHFQNALEGGAEMLAESSGRDALLGNLEAQRHIRQLLANWGLHHLN
jgi:hypothetical protein